MALNDKIVFKDTPGGGYFCYGCRTDIHPDMVPTHKCKMPDLTLLNNKVDLLVLERERYSKALSSLIDP